MVENTGKEVVLSIVNTNTVDRTEPVIPYHVTYHHICGAGGGEDDY